MRQRKVKDLEEKIEAVRAWLVEDPAPEVWEQVFPVRREQVFPESREQSDSGRPTDAPLKQQGISAPRRPLFLEIGCGKGDFLLQHAQAHPDCDYIGIEGQASVVLRAMEKAQQLSAAQTLDNVRFVCAFVNDMADLFAPGSLDGIYLNFSDPWPKARHAKRRLTWRGRLQDYARALRPGGSIAVKTDNDALFEFTLEEIAACGWTPAELTRDLHGSGSGEEARSAADPDDRELQTALTGGSAADPDGIDPEARQFMTEYEKKFHATGKAINYVKIRI